MSASKTVPQNPEISSVQLEARKTFPLQLALGALKASAITSWEEVKCIGYNPQFQRLEAIIDIKQSSGYNGGLCTNASREYIRFYVDFKDGGGFRDLGLTSFKASDIPNTSRPLHHPLSYMVYLYINDAQYRRFTQCTQGVIPTMRAILSWNVAPTPNDPGYGPHYGNIRNAEILLERKKFIIFKDILELSKSPQLKTIISPEQPIPLPDPAPVVAAEIHETNLRAKVPDHRTFFATLGSAVHSSMDFSQSLSQFQISELSALKLDLGKLLGLYTSVPNEKKADISFEEVTCVGLNPDTDTLGAVVHIKKSTGYNGDLCHKGSNEHVAFWADWNNDGHFDEYLGTVTFQTHDIANIPAGGLYYNVALPFDISKRLKSCHTPNIIRVRAVLSWEALPSTTNPDLLNTWGDSIDALVQLRPGDGAGLYTIISLVGNVDRLAIDPIQHLYNYNFGFPTENNNRPWGGVVNFCGIIDRNGFNGTIKYRLSYKPLGAPDSAFQPVSKTESFGRWIPPSLPTYISQTADADGWYVYDVNPALGIFDIYDNGLLANLQTAGLTDGTYTIRFEYTDELGNPVTGDEFSIVVCNEGMTVSATANTSVDLTKDIDLVIDGGDCHSYGKADPIINGHLRAIHPYFGSWSLELQPSSHTHGVVPAPSSRTYSSTGDDGDANAPWTLETGLLDPCGYTVSLSAHTRVILNSSPGYFPYYGPKAVGFAKQL